MLKPLEILQKIKIRNLISAIKMYYQTRKGKIVVFSGCGFLVLIAVSIVLFQTFFFKQTFTDSSGTSWHKFDGSNEPMFKVYVEQPTLTEPAYVNSECDPQLDMQNLTKLQSSSSQNYRNGIDRPNHCRVIAGYYQTSDSETEPANTFILLPDGSLLTLDGSQISTVQVNIDENGTRVVQSSGNVYYRIAKQTQGKKFVIQVGNQEFTALGTKVFSSIDADTVKLGLFEGAGTLTEFTRDSEAVQVEVGMFAQYLYKSVEQIKVSQLLKMSTTDLLDSKGFFARQLENDDLQGLNVAGQVDFSQMQAILPEVVDIAEDNLMNKMQSDIEESSRQMQEAWDNAFKEIEAEDARRAAERKEAHEERMREQQAANSQSSQSSSSTGSSDTSSGNLGCVSSSTKPATYSLCKMGGGKVSGSTCCFK